MANLDALMRAYAEARAAADAARSAADEAKELQRRAEAELVRAMADEGLKGAKDEAGRAFTLTRKIRYSCPPDMKAQMMEQLEADGMRDLFTVNPGTLSTLMKELAESNGGELPDKYAYMNEYEEHGISMRKK